MSTPSTASTHSASHIALPESELYWAILPTQTPGAKLTGRQITRHTEELDEQFADFLPVGIETLKPAYVALDANRTLASAVTRDRLTAAAGAHAICATPASIPHSILPQPESAHLAAQLNFLWGDTEAARVLAAKRRATLTAAAAIVLIAAVALIGLERRTTALRASTALHHAQTEATLNDLYRKPPAAALAALDQDLARLTRTRTPRASTPADAADALQSLLTGWPRGGTADKDTSPAQDSHAVLRTDALTVTPTSLNLTVALQDRATTGPLSDALRAIPGWKLLHPSFTAAPISSNGQDAAGTLSLNLTADPTHTAPATPQPAKGGTQ